MRGSKSEKLLREQEKARAEQLLLVDVSDSFHLLLQQRREIGVLDAIRETLRERIRELAEREKIGRSRASELVAVQAQLYRVEAEWEQAQTEEQVSSQLLQFLTGLDAVPELKDPGPELPAAEEEDSYLSKGPSRPDVKAAEQSAQIARQELKVARSQFFPTVGVDGNYYVDRAGAAEEVKWDASLNVDVPLFQGGAASGASKEAESGVRQADLRVQQTRRVAIQEIRDAYAEYGGALARVRALTKALESTEESYQMQVQEYRLNLVNNLEVLSTLQTLQDTRREVTAALCDAHRLYWKLRATAGESIG